MKPKSQLIKGTGKISRQPAPLPPPDRTALLVFIDGPWADTFQRHTSNDLPRSIERIEEVRHRFGPGKATFAGMTFHCLDFSMTRKEPTHTYRLFDVSTPSGGLVGFYSCNVCSGVDLATP